MDMEVYLTCAITHKIGLIIIFSLSFFCQVEVKSFQYVKDSSGQWEHSDPPVITV